MRPTWFGGPTYHKGMYAGYRRLYSCEKWEPPFVWTGRVKLNEVMDPPVFGWGWRQGQRVWYEPKLNWMPMVDSNDWNIVAGVGNLVNPTAVGLSAEMRHERPTHPYGVRSGYITRWRRPLESSPIDGQWHGFRWEVHSHAAYDFYWDEALHLSVVEKLPATMGPGPVSVGWRLDFLDVQFYKQNVFQA